ncbi:hypothetical protein BCR32DRAFT_251817 [Anaeromyces robustus]|uniref:Uncharacterized protein n=1 Tax=Anaeromyces robustus TaxID=1754192 RepID=A0A1Y1VAZ6_9FUNG|nr:hypothetical protein BCR32DRAFT_251817 [Anaeromyces robustus]|eukprot:ORX51533.1 hypothetical protein BCR32DRAFT_251817 [Anaeromyces robustus]
MYTITKRGRKSKVQQFSILEKQKRGRKHDSDDDEIDIIEDENTFPDVQKHKNVTPLINNTKQNSNLENIINNSKKHVTIIDDDDDDDNTINYTIASTKTLPDNTNIKAKTINIPAASSTIQIPSHTVNSVSIPDTSTHVSNSNIVSSSLSTSSPKSSSSLSTNVFSKPNASSNSIKLKHKKRLLTNDNTINSKNSFEKSSQIESSNEFEMNNSPTTSSITTIRKNESKNSQITNNTPITNSVKNSNYNSKWNTYKPKFISENTIADTSKNTSLNNKIMTTSMDLETSMIPEPEIIFDDKNNSDEKGKTLTLIYYNNNKNFIINSDNYNIYTINDTILKNDQINKTFNSFLIIQSIEESKSQTVSCTEKSKDMDTYRLNLLNQSQKLDKIEKLLENDKFKLNNRNYLNKSSINQNITLLNHQNTSSQLDKVIKNNKSTRTTFNNDKVKTLSNNNISTSVNNNINEVEENNNLVKNKENDNVSITIYKKQNLIINSNNNERKRKRIETNNNNKDDIVVLNEDENYYKHSKNGIEKMNTENDNKKATSDEDDDDDIPISQKRKHIRSILTNKNKNNKTKTNKTENKRGRKPKRRRRNPYEDELDEVNQQYNLMEKELKKKGIYIDHLNKLDDIIKESNKKSQPKILIKKEKENNTFKNNNKEIICINLDSDDTEKEENNKKINNIKEKNISKLNDKENDNINIKSKFNREIEDESEKFTRNSIVPFNIKKMKIDTLKKQSTKVFEISDITSDNKMEIDNAKSFNIINNHSIDFSIYNNDYDKKDKKIDHKIRDKMKENTIRNITNIVFDENSNDNENKFNLTKNKFEKEKNDFNNNNNNEHDNYYYINNNLITIKNKEIENQELIALAMKMGFPKSIINVIEYGDSLTSDYEYDSEIERRMNLILKSKSRSNYRSRKRSKIRTRSRAKKREFNKNSNVIINLEDSPIISKNLRKKNEGIISNIIEITDDEEEEEKTENESENIAFKNDENEIDSGMINKNNEGKFISKRKNKKPSKLLPSILFPPSPSDTTNKNSPDSGNSISSHCSSATNLNATVMNLKLTPPRMENDNDIVSFKKRKRRDKNERINKSNLNNKKRKESEGNNVMGKSIQLKKKRKYNKRYIEINLEESENDASAEEDIYESSDESEYQSDNNFKNLEKNKEILSTTKTSKKYHSSFTNLNRRHPSLILTLILIIVMQLQLQRQIILKTKLIKI